MTITKKSMNIVFIVLVATLLFVSFANAWGVSSPYWQGNALLLKPGDSRTVTLTLQNMVEQEDIILKAELVDSSGIAQLADPNKEYIVPYKNNNIPVSIQIKIPDNADVNKEHIISVSFKQIARDEGKMLQLSGSVSTSFPVMVTGDEEQVTPEPLLAPDEPKTNTALGLMGLLIVVAIVVTLFIFWKKRKSSPEKTNTKKL